MQYAVWSPHHAPAAAATNSSGRIGLPTDCHADAAPMMTDSLGTTGKMASMSETAKTEG